MEKKNNPPKVKNVEKSPKNLGEVLKNDVKLVGKVSEAAKTSGNLTKDGTKVPENGKKSRKKGSSVVMLAGVFVLVVGLIVFLGNLLSKPGVRDAEYLVEIGTWVREDEPSVIWKFTEVGEGSLTTNNHENDYDFLWAIEGEVMKIETDWLATLNDEYIYKVNQVDQTLNIKNELGNWTFVPLTE